MKTLQDAFEHTLQDVYYAENALLKAMPQMAQKAQNEELRQAIEQHEKETQEQVRMLEQVFDKMGKKAEGKKCQSVEGLIAEAKEVMREAQAPALDAVTLAAAQANEHYEITRYGTLVAWAKELGMKEAEQTLQKILDQEKQTDQKLTRIAEKMVNQRADQGA